MRSRITFTESEKQVKRGDRLCQMKSTPTPSPHHHLHPADKRECTSDSGISHNSSPSLDWLRSRTIK